MANQKQVQTQFGTQKAIEGYATSDIHSRGESLSILASALPFQEDWLALDVGTGAGHTALTIAPKVARVIATDITPAMLEKTAELAAARGIANLETRFADAVDLPFENNTFDLLTCRLAMHHFPNPHQTLAEFSRVLKPAGYLGLADNITVPDKSAAAYYNAYEKLRDPSHRWVYPLRRLQKMLAENGFSVTETHQLSKEFEFHKWADRQSVSAANKEKLMAMMRNLPSALEELFAPRWADGTLYFSLWEAVIIAQKKIKKETQSE